MSTASSFSGKTVLISGAASGLGKQLAVECSSPDVKLALLDINESGLEDTFGLCVARGAKVFLLPSCDVSDLEAVKKIPSLLPQEFSDVDILICNAGITSFSDVTSFDVQRNKEIMSVNYFGTVNLVSVFLDKMISNKKGHIVGISSSAGVRGITKTACYSASKAAQATFLESIRVDLAPYNIKVTTIILGFVDTPINDFLKEKVHMPFMITPHKAATAILKAVSKERRSVSIPFSAKLMNFFARRAPDCVLDFIQKYHPLDKKQEAKEEVQAK
jgi:short-subunit dehydrogenase